MPAKKCTKNEARERYFHTNNSGDERNTNGINHVFLCIQRRRRAWRHPIRPNQPVKKSAVIARVWGQQEGKRGPGAHYSEGRQVREGQHLNQTVHLKKIVGMSKMILGYDFASSIVLAGLIDGMFWHNQTNPELHGTLTWQGQANTHLSCGIVDNYLRKDACCEKLEGCACWIRVIPVVFI